MCCADCWVGEMQHCSRAWHLPPPCRINPRFSETPLGALSTNRIFPLCYCTFAFINTKIGDYKFLHLDSLLRVTIKTSFIRRWQFLRLECGLFERSLWGINLCLIQHRPWGAEEGVQQGLHSGCSQFCFPPALQQLSSCCSLGDIKSQLRGL